MFNLSFSRFMLLLFSATTFNILSQRLCFVNNFFIFFQDLHDAHPQCPALSKALRYNTKRSLFCQALFSLFLHLFRTMPPLVSCPIFRPHILLFRAGKAGGAFRAARRGIHLYGAPRLIPHPRSDRSPRPFFCKQPRMLRRCPRPGTRRSCAPTDSSEGSLPLGSWASC